MTKKNILLSSAYFPPIQYFKEIITADTVYIERYEYYEKQTYKNRCAVQTANGMQFLSVPVKKISGKKSIISDIEIDYSENWQKKHKRAVDSAYSKSPFHEFYIDAFNDIFNKKYKFLWDLNIDILNICLSELEIKTKIEFTTSYKSDVNEKDFRNLIHPKRKIEDAFFNNEYRQVFSERFEFMPNLSILDLLFNLGTESLIYLNR